MGARNGTTPRHGEAHDRHHHDPHHHRHGDDGLEQPATAVVKDPVCGMRVDPQTTPHRLEHLGQTFHFCSAGCRTKFATAPERYLGGTPAPTPVPTSAAAIYTCPMHPQV